MAASEVPLLRREANTALAVLVALALAVGGALLGRGAEAGPALAVTSLSTTAGDALQGIGDVLPLGYAFAAGLAAAVNPCGFALLPGYLGLYLGAGAGGRSSLPRAVVVGGTMTASFVALFGLMGLVLATVATSLVALLPWVNLIIGLVLVLAGGRLLGVGRLTSVQPSGSAPGWALWPADRACLATLPTERPLG
jgi:cytochrome c biogenesis protein CcdA